MEKQQAVICGIQQVGIGVPHVQEAYVWYKKFFGTDVVIFDEKAQAEYMLHYTDGKPRLRHAVLALNLQGGGGFEIWQHLDFSPRKPEFEVLPGDFGIWACKIKCKNAAQLHKLHLELQGAVSPVYQDFLGREYYYLTDPYGNKFQVVEVKPKEAWFRDENNLRGGVYGAVVGTKDIEASIHFYKEMLGYDTIYKDETKPYEDLSQLGAMGVSFRRVLLGHSQSRKGAFSRLLGPSEIELIQAIDRPTPCRLIFENRMWGELGFIQICYDIRQMDSLRDLATQVKSPFTADSMRQNAHFDMGEAAGNFAYNEDPSGTLIEYVETRRVPVLKKLGVYLNVAKYSSEKALPDWIVACLRFRRK